MVGTALVNNLKNIRDNKNRTRPGIKVDEIYEYDLDSTPEELDAYCQKADFVFNLAGVNRPENPEDFMKGNFGFASELLDTLKNMEIRHQSCCPLRFRQLWQDVLVIRNMVVPNRREKNCFSSMEKRMVSMWQYIVSRI